MSKHLTILYFIFHICINKHKYLSLTEEIEVRVNVVWWQDARFGDRSESESKLTELVSSPGNHEFLT